MKRIGKGYYIAAVLLLLWAAADVCHYVTIGRELISYYDGSDIIQQLVHNTLFHGVVKLLLAALILLIGWLRRNARQQRPASLTAVTALLVLAVLGIWGAGMYCVTAVAAQYAAERYLTAYRDFASTLSTRSFYHWMGKGFDQEYANYDANRMWEAADSGGWADTFHTSRAAAEGTSGFLDLPDSGRVCSVAAVCDGAGNLLVCGWEDYFYFEYLTQEQWQNREERSGNSARAPIDRSHLTQAGLEMVQNGDLTFDARALRFTGSFDGTIFTPQKIEAVEWDVFDAALRSKGSGSYTVSGVAVDYDLPWISLYEDPDAVSAGAEITTLYSDWFHVCWYRPSPAFSYDGSLYPGLDALVAQLGPALSGGWQSMIRYEGLDLIIPSVDYCYSFGDEVYYSPNYYGQSVSGTDQLHFYVVSAVYCSPWRTAWGELRYVYLVTFLLAAALILLVRSAIRRGLTDPATRAVEALEDPAGAAVRQEINPRAWREGQRLQTGVERWGDVIRAQKNEITRLTTALDYAKTAEENRRQMISHMAHELKTPLAILHSYAEGLNERIAEDKREKYIAVIQAETERMDALVLGMLDLSRLEAGKVKLARDDFSLADLARSVFDRLERSIQARGLTVTFDFPEESTVTADEGRIAQVVENFASNAVKYTTEGGSIAVSIRRGRGETTFAVANDCQPLPNEVLARIWDPFFRADDSRAEEGTGLGLAIAKRIVELHGGRCAVWRTETGLAFSFTI